MAKKRAKKVEELEEVKKIPTGIQVVSIIHYIAAGLCAVFGLLFIVFSGRLAEYLMSGTDALTSLTTSDLVGTLIVLGVLFIILGVLYFFIGKGLWKLKKWARIVGIILAVIVALYTLYMMTGNFTIALLIIFLIDVAVGVYLIFSKEAKKISK